MEQKCERCGGKGKICFYRSDIENFDETLCPECHGKGTISKKEEKNL